jgi:AAA family ATP:ADP antiporter
MPKFLIGMLNRGSKFYLLSFMMFSIVFNQTCLRILKDSVIISEIGPEAVAFIKIFFVLPVVALFLSFYNKLTKILSYANIYFYIIFTFVIVIGFFAFVFYPNAHFFQKSPEVINSIVSQNPYYFKWFIKIGLNWGYVCFYVLAEMWPDVFYTILFWTLLNHIYSTKEAMKSYSFISLIGNTAIIVASLILKQLTKTFNNDKLVLVKFGIAIIIFFAIVNCIIITIIFRSKEVYKLKLIYQVDEEDKAKKKKVGFSESLSCIANSRYLIFITLFSLSFYCCFTLTEFVWRKQISELQSSFSGIAQFLSFCNLYNGITCVLVNALLNTLLRYFGILSLIKAVPIVVIVASGIFFTFTQQTFLNQYFPNHVIPYSILYLSVILGAVQNITAKATKYSIWDLTKEILYIPLGKHEKTIGKASVDLISSKVGKSIASLIPIIVLTFSKTKVTEIIIYVFVLISITWLISTKFLCKEYTNKLNF